MSIRILRSIALGLLLSAWLQAGEPAAPPQPKSLTFEELAKLVDKPGNILFVDVRKPEEFASLGTLKGALNIPLDQVPDRLKELPKDRPIVVVCRSGHRSGLAATLLQEKGFQVLGSGGLKDFAEKKKDVLIDPQHDAKK